MKVYVVDTSWKKDGDYGCYYTIYSTIEKARECFEEEIILSMERYGVDKRSEFRIAEEKHVKWTDKCNEEYFDINIYIEEVL